METHARHFQDELDELKRRLLEMGGLAEDRLQLAVKGIVDRDLAVIDWVLGGDSDINKLHVEIDDRCVKLLALHQPMAVDLRSIVAAVKINTDLELAHAVLTADDRLDALKSQVFRDLLAYMLADQSTIEAAIDLILISRHLERVGDHATNVAEDVIFMVTAKDVRHQ